MDATKITPGASAPVNHQHASSHEGEKRAGSSNTVSEHREGAKTAGCGPAARSKDNSSNSKQHNQDGPVAQQRSDAVGEGSSRKRRRRRRGRRNNQKNNHKGPAYGALDLGTNNCRLLVACPAQSGFRVIDAFSRIVRLGEGVSKSGSLSPQAMDRCIGALKVCASKLKWRGVERSRLIATEACRVTENGAEFIERVVHETGLELEIIDRETEARLAFAGSAPLIAPDCENALVFDIGGGSTELMWVRIENGVPELIEWVSLPVGVVTIAEGYGGIEVTPDSYANMKAHAYELLSDFVNRVILRMGSHVVPDHLLGTSGTVTTIAGVHLGLQRYDRSKVDGCWMSFDQVSVVTNELLGMSYQERAASPCIGRERADLVLAGCAIFDAIRHRWPAPHVRVADRGLREGILTMLMQEDGTYGKPQYQLAKKQ